MLKDKVNDRVLSNIALEQEITFEIPTDNIMVKSEFVNIDNEASNTQLLISKFYTDSENGSNDLENNNGSNDLEINNETREEENINETREVENNIENENVENINESGELENINETREEENINGSDELEDINEHKEVENNNGSDEVENNIENDNNNNTENDNDNNTENEEVENNTDNVNDPEKTTVATNNSLSLTTKIVLGIFILISCLGILTGVIVVYKRRKRNIRNEPFTTIKSELI